MDHCYRHVMLDPQCDECQRKRRSMSVIDFGVSFGMGLTPWPDSSPGMDYTPSTPDPSPSSDFGGFDGGSSGGGGATGDF